MHLLESFKNACGKVALIPTSFCPVIVPVWLFCGDGLIPSRKGCLSHLPSFLLICYQVTHLHRQQLSPKTQGFESGDNICPRIYPSKVKLWGSNLSQFLKYISEGVLELLAPIYKREKSDVQHPCFFPLGCPLPVLNGGGGDRLSTEAFLAWSDSVWPYPCRHFARSPQLSSFCQWGGAAVDPAHPKLVSSSLPSRPLFDLPFFLWCHPECNRVVFWNISQAKTPRESIHLPGIVLTAVQVVSHEGNGQKKQQHRTKMSLLSVATPVHVTAKELVDDWPVRKKRFLCLFLYASGPVSVTHTGTPRSY